MTPQAITTNETATTRTISIEPEHSVVTCFHIPETEKQTIIEIQPNAQAVLCEQQCSSAEIIVHKNAQLNMVSLQTTASQGKAKKTYTIHEKAIVRSFTGLFHGADIEIVGELQGAHGVFANHLLYTGTEKERIQIQLHAKHTTPHALSRSIIRGMATDAAHVAFSGLITIQQNGTGTDTHLEHEGLLLSEHARISALPELNVETNDVKATHSSAIHLILSDQLFYLQTRGLDQEHAVHAIINGFLEEMLFIVHEESMIEQIRAMIQEKLA